MAFGEKLKQWPKPPHLKEEILAWEKERIKQVRRRYKLPIRLWGLLVILAGGTFLLQITHVIEADLVLQLFCFGLAVPAIVEFWLLMSTVNALEQYISTTERRWGRVLSLFLSYTLVFTQACLVCQFSFTALALAFTSNSTPSVANQALQAAYCGLVFGNLIPLTLCVALLCDAHHLRYRLCYMAGARNREIWSKVTEAIVSRKNRR